MIKTIYNSICTQIQNQLPAIKTIEPWNSQLQHYPQEKARAYPCLYLDFSSISFTPYGQGRQTATIQLRLYLLTHSLVNDTLEAFDLAEQLHAVLQLFSPELCGPMHRLSMQTDTDHDSLYVLRMDYTFEAADDTDLRPGKEVTNVVLQIDTELEG